MHVGMGVFFQGLEPGRDDHDVVRGGLALADQAEGRGFESIWTAEHHFTRYHMMPNPAQLLTYFAGRTTAVRLGTMVMVLPWHDPVRVAEEIAWLDSVSRGRVVLGVGRGLGSIEFDSFRLDMGQSRQRFVEYATAISASFETGAIQHNGELYVQPRAEIHPPAFTTFRGRTYASAVSPESAKIMARLGYGLMLIAQKPWQVTVSETAAYRELFVEVNGHEPPAPVLVNFTTVDPDPVRARELHDEYATGYARSTIGHYEFTNERLEHINGYEYYAGLRANITKHGLDRFNRFLADLQMGGTPDELVDQTVERVRALGAGGVVNIFGFGGMPQAVAQRTYDVYTEQVLPRLRGIDTFRDICAPLQRGIGQPAVGSSPNT
ncbi:LLM class flavin-dependent oxidoreductase [Pseudonocardia spinosispora]|uniref:LLM class flavin-dependent oxidoreductase n=1 Tax=Pseudonocardia spinosispora TaxID=103441 RepID=UPI0004142C8A|nr:LLM class flavin-dependent oxidoreductase [Pseudonocardia spinosispora]